MKNHFVEVLPLNSYLFIYFIYLFIYLFYPGGNPCQPKAGSTSCSHACLLAPKDSYPDGYSCHCPPGLFLLYDTKTCDTAGNIIIIEMYFIPQVTEGLP